MVVSPSSSQFFLSLYFTQSSLGFLSSLLYPFSLFPLCTTSLFIPFSPPLFSHPVFAFLFSEFKPSPPPSLLSGLSFFSSLLHFSLSLFPPHFFLLSRLPPYFLPLIAPLSFLPPFRPRPASDRDVLAAIIIPSRRISCFSRQCEHLA